MTNSKVIENNIFFNDRTVISIEQIRNYIELKNRELKAEGKDPLSALLVDYLQLIKTEKQGKVREQEVAQISLGLKAIAKDFNLAVIALSQVSRTVTKLGDKRPQLSDLRESGAIEQDADVVMFIHRPEYYNILENENGESTLGIAEIVIAKNRDGECGVREMQFEGKFQRFSNKGSKVFVEPDVNFSI
jgi:replicative DNA helicase